MLYTQSKIPYIVYTMVPFINTDTDGILNLCKMSLILILQPFIILRRLFSAVCTGFCKQHPNRHEPSTQLYKEVECDGHTKAAKESFSRNAAKIWNQAPNSIKANYQSEILCIFTHSTLLIHKSILYLRDLNTHN